MPLQTNLYKMCWYSFLYFLRDVHIKDDNYNNYEVSIVILIMRIGRTHHTYNDNDIIIMTVCFFVETDLEKGPHLLNNLQWMGAMMIKTSQ